MTRTIALFSLAILLLTAAAGLRALRSDSADDVEPMARVSAPARTAEQVSLLEQQVRDRPDDAQLHTTLAAAYLQRLRETADAGYYGLADRAVGRALELDGDDVRALTVAGALALSRHDFAEALAIGERARSIEAGAVAPYGIITDALMELGRYDEAVAAAQQMLDRRPDFASYSRVSYIRELHGDLPGAIAAMEAAVEAGSGAPQDVTWGLVLLGNLRLTSGDVEGAAEEYERAGALLPDDANVRAGLARLATARGDAQAAETHLRAALDRTPLPEYAIALGDVLASEGRMREAGEQYALVRAIAQLFAANGVDTDLELALFEADHGGDAQATYERARAAYERRPSVQAADVLAWAAFRAGRIEEARRRIAEAMRLGTRDSRMAYHAGVIAEAAGDAVVASEQLARALASPGMLTPREAAEARVALRSVDGG
ncbi:MAG: tetratricopeptide repeat protein [Dehalococcoidia bacterium]